MTWLIAFVVMILTDIFWARWSIAANALKPALAGVWAVLLFFVGAAAVIGYTNNHWLIIPSAAGSFVGTWIGVWLEKRKKEKQ